MDENTLNIEELLHVLKKRFRLIIISTLAFTLLAGIYATFKMKPTYEAKVKIFAGKSEEIQSNYSQDELKSYSSLMNTYIQLIKTEDFMNKIIDKANLDMTPSQLMNGLVFITSGDTPILEIKYSSSNPTIAENVINAVTSEFEVGIKEIILNTYTKVIDSVKVVEKVPAKAKVVLVGLIAGLLLGIGLAFVMDYLDDTLSRKEELEKLLPVPVLGELPLEDDEISRSKKNKRNNKKVS